MFARRALLLLRAGKTRVRCHSDNVGSAIAAARADTSVAKYLMSRAITHSSPRCAAVAAVSLSAGIGLQLSTLRSPAACEHALCQSAPVAQRVAASLPTEKEDSAVASHNKSSLILLLRCARRTAYLLLVFAPLLLLYPLSRWQVRLSLRFAQKSAPPNPFLDVSVPKALHCD